MTTDNTDLKSMTVEKLIDGIKDCMGSWGHTRELARRLEESQKKIVAQEAKDNYVGRWLSAALNDPSVCEEMKADIGLWMAEVAAEALGQLVGRLSSDHYFVGAEEAIRITEELAAEYRAKAGRKE